MPLDPQARAYLDLQAAFGAPPRHTLSAAAARQLDRTSRERFAETPQPVAHIENRVIAGPAGALPVRIYTPEGKGPFPRLIYFHGGGWVLGSLDGSDALCRDLTNRIGCVVVSVDYRLAPEHPAPAAAEDCYAATVWAAGEAASQGDESVPLAVCGDSAGGNLAAVVTLLARDRGGPPLAFQALIYPITDYYEPATPSYLENAQGYGLSRDDMIWYWNAYAPDATQARQPYVSPLRAPDLRGLPPALVLTAEYDLLRDEGERYGEALRAAGVPTTIIRHAGMIHGFVNAAQQIGRAQVARHEIAEAVRAAFGRNE